MAKTVKDEIVLVDLQSCSMLWVCASSA